MLFGDHTGDDDNAAGRRLGAAQQAEDLRDTPYKLRRF